jgi:hypothetical protein
MPAEMLKGEREDTVVQRAQMDSRVWTMKEMNTCVLQQFTLAALLATLSLLMVPQFAQESVSPTGMLTFNVSC